MDLQLWNCKIRVNSARNAANRDHRRKGADAMADTLNYKCPNCSAGLTFESKSQKMKCEYCGSTYLWMNWIRSQSRRKK